MQIVLEQQGTAECGGGTHSTEHCQSDALLNWTSNIGPRVNKLGRHFIITTRFGPPNFIAQQDIR